MARARNIKPSFFENDLLGELPALDRLFFIGLWTVADYRGCVEFRPKKLQVQILPYDQCDVNDIAINLEQSGFVRLYSVQGKTYLKVLNFEKHQNPHKNERDKGSDLPDIDKADAEAPETKGLEEDTDKNGTAPDKNGSDPADPCFLIPDSQSLNPDPGESDAGAPPPPSEKPASKPKRATRIPDDWVLTDEHWNECQRLRPDLVDHLEVVAATFFDHWKAKPGKDGTKTDWMATWRNWLRKEKVPRGPPSTARTRTLHEDLTDKSWANSS